MAEEGASTRQRKLRNVCTASDYDELRKAYRFVPEPPSEGSSNWQERMARRYESHLYREFVLADLTRHQMGQIGLRWRTKDEVCSGKGFDTCGNKHCPSYRSPDGSSFRDIEAARRASLSRASEESVRRYLGLQEQKDKVSNQASRATHRDCVKDACDEEEEEEMNALSQLSYGSGMADYEVPFTYLEEGVSKTELVKLRLCLRCAPLLFSGRGGYLGAKRARERSHDEKKLPVSTTKQEKNEDDDDDEDASSVSSQRSCSPSTDEDSRRKRRASKKSRKRKNDKRRHRSDRGVGQGSGERRRKRKRRGEGRRNEKKEGKASTGAISDDISIEGRKAEEGLLASLDG